jgi:3-oxoacyl-[acyl-carrier protein] reductase
VGPVTTAALPEIFRLDGRVAVVTGGGSGIGRAICEALAAAGAVVTVGDINDEWAAETCARITFSGGQAFHQHADVSNPGDCELLVTTAAARHGRFDILCNLGGPPAPFVELADVTDEQLDSVLSTHLKSVIYGCRAAVPLMMRNGGGAIVNMASSAADRLAPANGLYALAKNGVMVVTRVLALELGRHGIRVNGIAPGATLTNFSRRYFTDDDGTVDQTRRQQWLERMATLSPLGLTGTPEDQAWLVLYLVSPAARFVTGQVIRANGGWSMV